MVLARARSSMSVIDRGSTHYDGFARYSKDYNFETETGFEVSQSCAVHSRGMPVKVL